MARNMANDVDGARSMSDGSTLKLFVTACRADVVAGDASGTPDDATAGADASSCAEREPSNAKSAPSAAAVSLRLRTASPRSSCTSSTNVRPHMPPKLFWYATTALAAATDEALFV